MLLANNSIKLLIADDHPTIRRGLKDLFARQNEIHLVGVACNGKEVLALLGTDCPHVVLSDIKMPEMCGRELCKTIRQQYPHIQVLAYSMFDDSEAIIEMRRAGACGHVLKSANEEEIFKAIRTAYEGGEYYCTSIRQRITSLFTTGALSCAVDEKKQEYCPTELKIIRLLCQEYSSKEIADELKMNKRSVEHCKERIQEKMGVKGSIGIAVYAVNNWLLY